MLTRLLQQAWRTLPSQCAVCRAWPAQTFCADCIGRFARPRPRCQGCALPVPAGVARCGACLRQPPPVDVCLCALDWDWPWAQAIAQFKFGQETGLAAPLAALLLRADGVAAALAAADAVVPMPLSRQRLAGRGYNQALLLARHLCAELRQSLPGRPPGVLADALQRTRDAPAQRGLGRAQRLKNVRGAFALHPASLGRVRGRRLVLVDDVMTTGATLFEAARTLRDGGAAHISAVVLARTDAPAVPTVHARCPAVGGGVSKGGQKR